MRITHVIPSLGTGGAEALTVGLANEMVKQGHDVEIVVFAPSQGVPFVTAQELGLQVRVVGRNPRDLSSLGRLSSALRNQDVVHAHLFPALYFVPLVHPKGIRIYTEHSTNNRRRGNAAFRLFDRMAYSSFDTLTAISVGAADSLEKYGSQLGLSLRAKVITNGISNEYFDVPLAASRSSDVSSLKAISVGTLDHRKNFADALRIIARTEDVTLTLVGDGPDRAALERLAGQLGILDRVTFAGRRSDVLALLDNHDVFMSTSRYEGFGLAAAEALARGLPVIAPNVPGISEVVGSDAVSRLIPQGPDFISHAAQTLDEFAHNRSLLRRSAKDTMAIRSRFRLDSVATQYLALYHQSSSAGSS